MLNGPVGDVIHKEEFKAGIKRKVLACTDNILLISGSSSSSLGDERASSTRVLGLSGDLSSDWTYAVLLA